MGTVSLTLQERTKQTFWLTQYTHTLTHTRAHTHVLTHQDEDCGGHQCGHPSVFPDRPDLRVFPDPDSSSRDFFPRSGPSGYEPVRAPVTRLALLWPQLLSTVSAVASKYQCGLVLWLPRQLGSNSSERQSSAVWPRVSR